MYSKLELEPQLVMHLSRMYEEVDENRVREILEQEIDWNRVFTYGYKNKVMYLIYDNMRQLGLDKYVPNYFSALIKDAFYCNKVRNTEKLKELDKVLSIFNEQGVACVPVKGGYLIDNVYNNRSARVSNDIDALILKKDIKKIECILADLGYIVGEVNRDNNSIKTPSREKKVLYKTKMYNLLPFTKPGEVVDHSFIVFDLSFALDFSLDTTPVEEMIECSIEANGKKQLLPEHFFVHMCCHHYREASHIEWIRIGKDLTVMKFCDVHSFVKMKMNRDTLNKAVLFAKKHGLEKAVYFTVYCLDILYHDGYELDVLEQLEIEDKEFLFKFSDDGRTLNNVRKKDLWASIFSEDNRDEINNSKPTYDLIS